MSNRDHVKKSVYRVILNSGQVMEHVYDIPNTKKEADKQLKEYAERIFMAMAPGVKGTLWFLNPPVVYNPDNVAAVEVQGITTSELEKAAKRASTKAGFVKPS